MQTYLTERREDVFLCAIMSAKSPDRDRAAAAEGLPVLHFDGQPYVLIDDVKEVIAARRDSDSEAALDKNFRDWLITKAFKMQMAKDDLVDITARDSDDEDEEEQQAKDAEDALQEEDEEEDEDDLSEEDEEGDEDEEEDGEDLEGEEEDEKDEEGDESDDELPPVGKVAKFVETHMPTTTSHPIVRLIDSTDTRSQMLLVGIARCDPARTVPVKGPHVMMHANAVRAVIEDFGLRTRVQDEAKRLLDAMLGRKRKRDDEK